MIARRELWKTLTTFEQWRPFVEDALDKQDARYATIEAKLDRQAAYQIGILISLTTAIILLSINLAIGTLG